jgi:hypothetical protein
MLKTVAISSNKKTGPIAVTYRSGNSDIFGTCPKTCGLLPKGRQGAAEIDTEYMRAVLESVPRGGRAWTYSHFDAESLPCPEEGKTVINASCDSMNSAVRAYLMGRPAVYAAPVGTEWAGGVEHKGVKFVRCPAELSDEFTCHDCGNGSPLCARGNRDYVVVFVAHGPSKKRVGTGEGGCYGSSGPVAIQWHKTRETGAPNDGEALRSFARSLPEGSLLRHHVVGDMGASC